MNKNDVSYKSIKMIEEKFQSRRSRRVWVPDWGIEYDLEVAEGLDALLMGSYFERIFQVQFWPTCDFNLFCLSPQVRKILIEIFEFEPGSVGCLSRYNLFPEKKSANEEYSFNNETQFYYVGRISPQKNIEFLIMTIFHLQILYSSNIQLKFFGDFDNEYHKDILDCHFAEYKNKIEILINGLPWVGACPTFQSGLDEHEWLKLIPPKGISISATSLISEDFSVTAAQLQTLGRAMLIPEWGGLKDVRGENVRHYNVNWISNSHTDIKTISRMGKRFAQNIIENIGIKKLPILDIKDFIPSKKINRSYLEDIIIINKKKWGDSIEYLVKNDLVSFVRTTEGQKVLSECRRIFSEPI